MSKPNQSMHSTVFCGIDVSAATLAAAVHLEDQRFEQRVSATMPAAVGLGLSIPKNGKTPTPLIECEKVSRKCSYEKAHDLSAANLQSLFNQVLRYALIPSQLLRAA